MRPDNKRFTRCISARKRAGKAHDNSAYRVEKNKPQGPIATDRKRKRTDHATQDAWEHRLRSQTNQKMTSDCAYSHSIINRPRRPAWLKGLAVIDMGRYRRFYRHGRRPFTGAVDGAICGAATLATTSSITSGEYSRQRTLSPPSIFDRSTCAGPSSFSMAAATASRASITPSKTKSSARP